MQAVDLDLPTDHLQPSRVLVVSSLGNVLKTKRREISVMKKLKIAV